MEMHLCAARALCYFDLAEQPIKETLRITYVLAFGSCVPIMLSDDYKYLCIDINRFMIHILKQISKSFLGF